jgi:hypothetical protein
MITRRLAPFLFVVLLALLTAPLKAQTGDLQVTVSTTGLSPDADGFVVVLDLQRRVIGVNDSVVFAEIMAGSHTVTLLDVPEGCTVGRSNSREAVVNPDEVAAVRFVVACALPGLQDRQRVREEAAAIPVEREAQRVPGAAQLEGREQAMVVRPQTTVEVRAHGKTGSWGTEATIHHHQEVMFLWDIGVSDVTFAEWQVWSQNPTGRSVPESAKMATGALEVTGETTLFPIHFGTFVPELPPELPAEQKYWVNLITKDAGGAEFGSPPTPVTVSFRACSDNQQCPEGYFCDPDKKVCDKIEVFCAAEREIPGYKGTGYRKDVWGGHIQGTDGSSVRCFGYKCKALPDGTPQCLCRCMSTADCDQGYSCTSDFRCVMN